LAYNSSSGNDIYAKRELFLLFNNALRNKSNTFGFYWNDKIIKRIRSKNFAEKLIQRIFFLTHQKKALSQRVLRKEYTQDKGLNANQISEIISIRYNDSFNEFKTPKRNKQSEHSKKKKPKKSLLLLTLLVVL
jgi:hypothetical protein